MGLSSLQADPSPLPLVSQTKKLHEAWPAKPGRIPANFTFHTRAVCLVGRVSPGDTGNSPTQRKQEEGVNIGGTGTNMKDKSGNGFGKYQMKALAS